MIVSAKRAGRMVAALFLLVLAIGVTDGYSQGFNIRGHLLSSLDHGEHIELRLKDQNGVIVSRAYTNSDGDFEFRGLGVGRYFVEITLDGFEPSREQVDITDRSGMSQVNITLKEKSPAPLSASDEAGAAHRLDILDKYPKRIVDEYDKVGDDIRKGDAGKAAGRLEGILKQAPDFYDAHNSLGTVYQTQGRYDVAELEYRKAAGLQPKSADPLLNLGSLYIQTLDSRVAKEGQSIIAPIMEKALTVLLDAMLLDKNSARAYYLLGTICYRENLYPQAEENLKHSLEIDKTTPGARLTLANVYMRQQKWQSAMEHLDSYLAENPKSPDHEQVQKTRMKVAENLKGAPEQK